MKYFMDCEFLEDGKGIDLISIGIVSEDGREFYAVSKEYTLASTSKWLWENVMPHLPPFSDPAWKTRAKIKKGILDFCAPEKDYGEPEFWGYHCDYDWVVFCWLFGTMGDLPQGYPMYCRDIMQRADDLGNPELPKQEAGAHDALADARHHKVMWEFLNRWEKECLQAVRRVRE